MKEEKSRSVVGDGARSDGARSEGARPDGARPEPARTEGVEKPAPSETAAASSEKTQV